jgi:transposase-like protein
MDGNQIILKQDRLGRVQRTAVQRAAIVEEFRRSGLTARRFAELSGIGYNTLWTWLHQAGVKLRNSPPQAPCEAPRLMRAVVALPALPQAMPPSSGDDGLCVALGNGVSFRVTSSAQASLAALLIRALNSSSPC